MAQALVLFHRESPCSWQRSEIHADRRKGQTLVSPPAEPGAYLYELAPSWPRVPAWNGRSLIKFRADLSAPPARGLERSAFGTDRDATKRIADAPERYKL